MLLLLWLPIGRLLIASSRRRQLLRLLVVLGRHLLLLLRWMLLLLVIRWSISRSSLALWGCLHTRTAKHTVSRDTHRRSTGSHACSKGPVTSRPEALHLNIAAQPQTQQVCLCTLLTTV